jgi:hypothetical protein
MTRRPRTNAAPTHSQDRAPTLSPEWREQGQTNDWAIDSELCKENWELEEMRTHSYASNVNPAPLATVWGKEFVPPPATPLVEEPMAAGGWQTKRMKQNH